MTEAGANMGVADTSPASSLITVAQAIRDGARQLDRFADNPRLEVRLLLAHALCVAQNDLIRAPERQFNPAGFAALLTRRQAREPMALILGHREFWSMDFQVSRATLIPRADSETLIQAAVEHFRDRNPPDRILDLGTGTGCLLLALLRCFPAAFGIGLDIAPEAAQLARRNADQIGLSSRAAFLCGDWTASLAGRFDLLISNPPYIAAGDIDRLMPEVANWEPRQALDGGSDGLDAYRAILPKLAGHLTERGSAILELGHTQAKSVLTLARPLGLRASLYRDLSGIQRAILLDRGDA